MEERIEVCLGKVPADILIHGELVARANWRGLI